jgi:aryl-alcohol dehydrogenase-like predicted oxidoreductase
MSNLVVGGTSLSRLTVQEVRNLLQAAESLGVCEIDTAPSYGSSQEKIGMSSLNSNWIVNSKVLGPSYQVINRRDVRESVENSLRELRIESIGTVFVHSAQAAIYNPEVHEELLLLKAAGKIMHVGYSGDGDDLKEITSSFSFDSFQATLNMLDLSNLDFIRRNDSMAPYLKRPLCNQVFKIKPRLEIVDLLYRVGKHKLKDPKSYLARYNAIFGSRLFRRCNAVEFLRFLLSLNLNSKIIVGVSSIDHLMELTRLESSFTKWNEPELRDYVSMWTRLARERDWDPLT